MYDVTEGEEGAKFVGQWEHFSKFEKEGDVTAVALLKVYKVGAGARASLQDSTECFGAVSRCARWGRAHGWPCGGDDDGGGSVWGGVGAGPPWGVQE